MSGDERPDIRAARFELELDAVPVQVWTIEGDRYGAANRCHAAFLGVPQDSLPGARYASVLPEATIASLAAGMARVRDGSGPTRTEFWATNADGERRLLDVTLAPAARSGGDGGMIVCTAHDVTDRLLASADLVRSEENFRRFLETIGDLVLIGDLEGRIIYSNPAASQKLGIPPEQLAGRSILALHPESVREEAATILAGMFRGERDTCPLPLQRADGTIFPVETRVWFGTWSGERCIFGLCKDLTAEQEALQKFDRLFRLNPALMALSDMEDRRFTEVNDAFLQVLGYRRNEVVGKTVRDLDLFPDQDEQDRAAALLAGTGSLREFELKVRTNDGSLRRGLFSGDIIESQGKRFFLTVMLDITERKKAEAEREQTIRELQNALEQIRTLKGIVPICVSCKKIRDDKGFWEQVEAYVSRHTEAEFSHGICPDCMGRYYPEYVTRRHGQD
ncbi:MAG TPA: PAS domain-containing protein [Candidatus Krumholzibacteria bacterium]|nr:PAS domain-containing protein [Candidatus Krumholzibacteria bacterium]